ncbi:VOC family protein [Marivirga sp.]|uniref:VOC family protein n=1 Tax=Marivirga sp. TaxID=2018662 RepID=UPI002D80E492|nr:VOC family protein [Marivirga sp.]HET8860322.1 VOC family protein [Marivirga sp.]
MSQINSYLTFNGNCREAMTFYQECLGGELMLQPVEGSPMANQMPKGMKNCILHSTLKTSDFVLMGSDITPESGLIKGNSHSLIIECNSESQIHELFEKLSEDGVRRNPIEKTFWGAFFGTFTDKFGHNWMLNFTEKH